MDGGVSNAEEKPRGFENQEESRELQGSRELFVVTLKGELSKLKRWNKEFHTRWFV